MRDRKPGALEGPMNTTEADRRKVRAGLSRQIQAKIGKQLRAYYGFLIEPVPDRFVELMGKLDKADDPEASP